jgi:hypothetical protein
MSPKRLGSHDREFGFQLDLHGDVALAGIKRRLGRIGDVQASVTYAETTSATAGA